MGKRRNNSRRKIIPGFVEAGQQFGQSEDKYKEKWGRKAVTGESPKDLSSGVQRSCKPPHIWVKKSTRESMNHPDADSKPKQIECGYQELGFWAVELDFSRKPGAKGFRRYPEESCEHHRVDRRIV